MPRDFPDLMYKLRKFPKRRQAVEITAAAPAGNAALQKQCASARGSTADAPGPR